MSKQNRIILIVIGFVVLIGGYVVISNNTNSTLPVNTSASVDTAIESQIAQYEILKRQNKMPDMCVMARTIAMMYLQQQDEASYTTWSATSESCDDAFMASQMESQP